MQQFMRRRLLWFLKFHAILAYSARVLRHAIQLKLRRVYPHLTKHHVMKTYWGRVQLWQYAFLTSALGVEWSASLPGRFTPLVPTEKEAGWAPADCSGLKNHTIFCQCPKELANICPNRRRHCMKCYRKICFDSEHRWRFMMKKWRPTNPDRVAVCDLPLCKHP
jgi:hypothetical protein